MSSVRLKKIPGIEEIPYIGALLRLAHQEVITRLLQALAERGMGDINQAYFGLFRYPPIDGKRPGELAAGLGVSKQALNHLLGQLEKLGYLERRKETESGHTAVYLTDKGWRVVESNVATMRALEADWQRRLGEQRFGELKAALRDLTGFG